LGPIVFGGETFPLTIILKWMSSSRSCISR